jgi:methionine-rich copper-binding protein CopC
VRRGVLLVLTALLCLTARPASAHTQLVSTSPASGDVLTTPPTEVVLTFSDAPRADFSTVVVDGPGGSDLAAGRVAPRATALAQAVAPGGGEGTWRVAYSVVSPDGHRVSGQYTFVVGAPGTVAAAPDEDDAGGAPWGVALGGVAVAAVVAGAAWRLSRRS